MHSFRTHKCGELRKDHIGQSVKLSGWVHRKRDHGGVLFIDLRDTYGITQIVAQGNPELERVRVESVVTIDGEVVARASGTANAKMPTGDIEIVAKSVTVQSTAEVLPFQVAEDDGAGEDIRLKYRYLDLRREGMHSRIRLRNGVVSSMRRRMVEEGFQEFQTPILTASSPEGARDYLVPSRLHPGKFYALPQAPQQFKQLLMMSGFDRYFQIAPCFRDEDGRADRLAEFYQLDMEMSFVEQEDIFKVMTKVIGGIFEEFGDFTGTKHRVEFLPNMPYAYAMLKYGTDKPDLRNPLTITDVTEIFNTDDVTFTAFKNYIAKGGVVRAIHVPQAAKKPRSFFDKLNSWAQSEGSPGLGYISFETEEGKGPIAKFVGADSQKKLRDAVKMQDGDVMFFVSESEAKASALAGKARTRIAQEMDIIEKGVYKLCWIVDFPMYEFDEKAQKIDFSHNPFSMPRGGMDALNADPLKVIANQYDCVCNGYELASGGIRNHKPEIMEKAFALAGYSKEVLEKKFGGMLSAFKFGAPPHGGCAFGVDRIVMLLANEPNLREVYAFVMNGQYEDPMMAAPSEITDVQLKDLHLKLNLPKKVEAA